MHAWDDIDALKLSLLSVFSQEQFSEGVRRIKLKLVVFVDRCGVQLDALSRSSCDRQKWCTILDVEDPSVCPSLGSAAAKWKLISHIRGRINPSDYFTFLDGDDLYMSDHVLMDIYTSHLLPKRPFFAWGRQTGEFSGQCRDLTEGDRIATARGEKQVRDLPWSYCHPRFFRGKLISLLQASDFKREDGKWLQKATDRPLIFAALELGGVENAIFMGDEAHVRYSFTERNGLKRFSKDIVERDKNFVTNEQNRFARLEDEIHVVVAVYDRTNTEEFIDHLLKSALPPNTCIKLHIANNLPSRQASINSVAKHMSTSKVQIKVTNMGKNMGGIARLFLTRDLLRTNLLDFVIFIDDDQYCHQNTIWSLWIQRKPHAMVSWFGKSWHLRNSSYWSQTFGFPEITAGINIPQNWQYAGTGMSVVDTLIFSDKRVYKIPKPYTFVEDLWLSYVLKVNGWELKRAFTLFSQEAALSDDGQYRKLKEVKEDMFSALKQCGFPLISEEEYTNTKFELDTLNGADV